MGERLWPAFSTFPVAAAHARRGDPPTVDLLVEVGDGFFHLLIACIDAQADLQLVLRARIGPDKLRRAYTIQKQSIETHPGPPGMVRDRAMLSVLWWYPCTWFVRRRYESHCNSEVVTMGAIATRGVVQLRQKSGSNAIACLSARLIPGGFVAPSSGRSWGLDGFRRSDS